MSAMARDDHAPQSGPDDEVDAGFRQFYDEVLQALATPGDPADRVAAEQAAQQVQKHLRGVIELQELQARRQAGRAAAALAEPVRYLKAALADEILLQREWAGRGAWGRRAVFTHCGVPLLLTEWFSPTLAERPPGPRDAGRVRGRPGARGHNRRA